MEWPLEKRAKLALKVRERAISIRDQETLNGRREGLSYEEISRRADERIMDLLGSIGFERVHEGMELERAGIPMIFRQSETRLLFETVQGKVVSISKDDAIKLDLFEIP